ncbi:hypothetical protein [Nocardioides panaciterrulae]|uniref:Uncharacterized protein n=1 Tax=Nocardioides panaciterrulae TaxID=661492 RepID=A0A7Y9E7F6_9ACTN|nr:hypothetical protein [Nocardioides panaciterrulae]NYD42604.1 hypothetical protein [Nocardioides panaciterrulae]
MSHTLLRRLAALLVASGLAALAVPVSAAGQTGHHDRPCFIVQAHWNVGLDGPQPRC